MEYTEEAKESNININTKVQELKANKTYFYEMPSGNIEPVEAVEAWGLYKKKAKQIGCSDGTTYRTALKEAQQLMKTEGIEKAQERLRKGLAEELEVARGNIEIPPNNDVFGPAKNEFNQSRISKMK